MHINTVATPSVVVFTRALQANIKRFSRMAQQTGVALRPHIKTHRSPQIMALQRQAGARGFTVSTLAEARACLRHGFDDLTWAMPVEPGKFDEARDTAASVATLHLLTDSPDVVRELRVHARHHYWRPSVFMKVDCGNHRVGVDPASETAFELAALLHNAPEIAFSGLLAHSGHAYHAVDDSGRRAAALEERDTMTRLAAGLRGRGIGVPAVSIGSTPAFATGIALPGIDEARPGNYVFFDYTQVRLGSCAAEDVALYVTAAVVSRQPERVVVDAGATILSKDPGAGAHRPPLRLRPGIHHAVEAYRSGSVPQSGTRRNTARPRRRRAASRRPGADHAQSQLPYRLHGSGILRRRARRRLRMVG